MTKDITVIIFEAGRVLVQPVTGHWFIPPNFFQIINPRAFEAIHNLKREAAFSQAAEVLLNNPVIRTKEEEYNLFLDYYRVFFSCLPSLKTTTDQIEQVARDLVYNPEKYVFFQDAREIIPSLSKDQRLAVMSDGWPSLEDVFIKSGLRQYFSTFFLSSVSGVYKPDMRVFESALRELDVAPNETIYVDENKENCNSAHRLGIPTILLCRDTTAFNINRLTCRTHRVIQNLHELPRFL